MGYTSSTHIPLTRAEAYVSLTIMAGWTMQSTVCQGKRRKKWMFLGLLALLLWDYWILFLHFPPPWIRWILLVENKFSLVIRCEQHRLLLYHQPGMGSGFKCRQGFSEQLLLFHIILKYSKSFFVPVSWWGPRLTTCAPSGSSTLGTGYQGETQHLQLAERSVMSPLYTECLTPLPS